MSLSIKTKTFCILKHATEMPCVKGCYIIQKQRRKILKHDVKRSVFDIWGIIDTYNRYLSNFIFMADDKVARHATRSKFTPRFDVIRYFGR